MAHSRVQVGAELSVVDVRRGAEEGYRRLGRDKPVAPKRHKLTNRHTIAGHNECLTLVQLAHDLAALVAQL